MAENMNLQSAQVIAKLFGLTPAQVETLRRQKVIEGVGSPKQYDLLPTIQAYIKHLQGGVQLRTAAELADLFGFEGTRRIDQLKGDGVITGEGKPTRYKLDETVKAYIGYLSEKAYGREQKQSITDLEEERLRAEVSMKQSKAQAAELELKELQGKLHRAEDVEAITSDHVLYLRSMLMAMPGKLAVDCATCKTAPEAADRIQQEVYYILNNLAEYRYDPEQYKQRVRERRGWEGEQHGDKDDE